MWVPLEAGKMEYMTVQDVLAAANQLSQEERLQVAIRLLESPQKTDAAPKETIAPSEETESVLDWKADLHPSVQRLVGAISSGDEDFQVSYIDYLEEKYS